MSAVGVAAGSAAGAAASEPLSAGVLVLASERGWETGGKGGRRTAAPPAVNPGGVRRRPRGGLPGATPYCQHPAGRPAAGAACIAPPRQSVQHCWSATVPYYPVAAFKQAARLPAERALHTSQPFHPLPPLPGPTPVGGPVLAACVLLFALVVVCRRIDWHRWRHGHPVEPPRGAVTAKLEVVVASPRPVKIPVVCLQPDRCLDVAFPYKARHARTASGASTGGDDGCARAAAGRVGAAAFGAAALSPTAGCSCGARGAAPTWCQQVLQPDKCMPPFARCPPTLRSLLTVMHAAPAGPLWSAAGVTRSEASGTPFDSPRSALWRPSGGPAVHDGLAAAAVFAAAQQQWQQQQQQQAAAPLQQPDAAAAPSAAAAPAAEGVAAAAAPPAAGGKHQRRRSFDLTWLARRAEKGAALVPDAAACSASPLCAEPSSSSSPVSVLPRAPLHGRSRSATLAAMV